MNLNQVSNSTTGCSLQSGTSTLPDTSNVSADRLILLRFKNARRKEFSLAFPETLHRAVPAYIDGLDEAIIAANPGERISITDSGVHELETILQVFDFLHSGNLPMITAQDAELSFLPGLLTLYNASIHLDIWSLEEAVGNLIITSIPHNKTLFPAFAEQCYNETNEVYPDSMLGEQFKRWMAENLFEPMRWDIIQEIKGIPIVSEQLLEIFMEKSEECEG